MMPRGAALLASALCGVLAAGCTDQRTNVVLITLDTTRADRIGAYGDETAATPNLDRLAERGVLFERAYASSPLTLPSHTTMMTGLEPHRHGVHDNGFFVVPDEVETVAERLEAAGYATGAFVSAFVLDGEFGLAQGFDVYDDAVEDLIKPLSQHVPSRRGNGVTDGAIAWLAGVGGRPYFLWAHYYDVHAPREPPPPFDALEDPYAGELAYVDREVGRLLDAVSSRGDAARTLVIVIADHGESLGDHGELTHGIVAYDSTLHVPLMIAGSGFEAGGRSTSFATTADVMPTILAAASMPIPEGLDGEPLQGKTAESTAAGGKEAVAYFESLAPHYNYGWAPIRGVRTPRWKYTAEPKPVELFDIEADPGELENLAEERSEVVAAMDDAYRSERSLAIADEERARLLQPSPDVQEKLEALGYVSAPSSPDTATEKPDSRALVKVPPLVDAAGFVAASGRVADGIEALEILASSPPAHMLALRRLASVYLVAGRYERAIEAFEELRAVLGPTVDLNIAQALIALGRTDDALERLVAVKTGTALSRARVLHAELLLALGQADQAEKIGNDLAERYPESDAVMALQAAVRADRDGAAAVVPELLRKVADAPAAARPRTRMLLAGLLHELGRDREAIAVIEGTDPLGAREYLLLAAIAAARDNSAEAIANYEKAAADWPASMDIRRSLADVYAEAGRLEDALASYELVLAANPDDVATAIDRAVVLTRVGRKEEAEQVYRQAIESSQQLPEAYFNLALLELQRDDTAQAEKHLLRAVELRPDFRKAHAHLAILYGDRDDPRAVKHAELAVLPDTPPIEEHAERHAP